MNIYRPHLYITSESEGFVYIWHDTVAGMKYVGKHKGPEDDGYVCSSKVMLPIYRSRPETFYREILFRGNAAECLKEERKLLKAANAKDNPNYYNRSNGGGTTGTKNPWNKGLTGLPGKPCAPETKRKLSQALKGRPSPMTGKSHTVETRSRISKANTGRVYTAEARRRMSAAKNNIKKKVVDPSGKVFESIAAAARAHSVTDRSIKNWCAKKEGWAYK